MDTIDSIKEGISYINDFLREVTDKTCVKPMFYHLPKFIYRGITKFYPYRDEKISMPPTDCDVEEGYIRSGLAIRLDSTIKEYEYLKDAKAYVRINYINILQDLIRNARKHYPEKYTSAMSDLYILADIQHNGGATCLVDFSKNILTALWFACNSDFQDDGFIYCYDIMWDMIVNDNLMYIKDIDENLPIDVLLYQTYRETNISSDIDTRFCLWEPSPKNNRILRQDSVFIFGIERFKVKEHQVKVIRIPANRKKKILLAMKGLFNISTNTIFNDYIGFANANNKFIPYHKMSNDSYNRGYFDMIKGNYSSALSFLKFYEGDLFYNAKRTLSLEDSLELHFSLAVCYKNLRRKSGEIIYTENAILEYKNVIKLSRDILKKNINDSYKRDYYIRKCSRAYNGILDMLYISRKYREAIYVCDELHREIVYGILNYSSSQFTLSGKKEFDSRYCIITQMELLDLAILQQLQESSGGELDKKQTQKEKDLLKMNDYYSKAIENKKNSYFDNLLISYYKLVFDIIMGVVEVKEYKEQMSIKRKELYNRMKNNKIYEGYILWNFADIKDAIDNLDENLFSEKKYYLQYATAHIISFRDEFEAQSSRLSQEY